MSSGAVTLIAALVGGVCVLIAGVFGNRAHSADAYHDQLRADNEGYRARMDAQDTELASLRMKVAALADELARVGAEFARVTEILHGVQVYARTLEDRLKIPHRRWNDVEGGGRP